MQSADRTELAERLKSAVDSLSPFIEKHTRTVCPDCDKVCCIDRHGRYDADDLIFLRALSLKMTEPGNTPQETDPCRHLTPSGCSLERWKRPFRCTHFFCDPLLQSLEHDNAKLYRAFIDYFQYLLSLRQQLIDEI